MWMAQLQYSEWGAEAMERSQQVQDAQKEQLWKKR